MKSAIVICSRLESSRVPGKALKKINGKPLLEHLLNRLVLCGPDVWLAVPHCDVSTYRSFLEKNDRLNAKVFVWTGSLNDPLARLSGLVALNKYDAIVRVNHDKIFIEPSDIKDALAQFEKDTLDYLYSSDFVPGSGFEVIAPKAIAAASLAFKNVEHIGYAIRCVTDSVGVFIPKSATKTDARLLVDYPEDLRVLELVLATKGNDCSLKDAVSFLDQNPWIKHTNKTPRATIYTCAHNAANTIDKTMGSISAQSCFSECEYLLIDDFSTDETPLLMAKFASIYKNVRWFRNEKNLGLASSSNVALSLARGKYITRIDADDYYPDKDALPGALKFADASGLDVIYPDNYFGSLGRVQRGCENHHVGGAIFKTAAANHVKFTDGLRGYEGYDFFNRAKDQLNIGYYSRPLFFYRQHDGSMSKSIGREEIKLSIDKRLGLSA